MYYYFLSNLFVNLSRITYIISGTNMLNLASNIIYLGLNGCLTCNFIGPVIKKSFTLHLVENLDYFQFENKQEYHKKALNLLENYNIKDSLNPIPIPLIFITMNGTTSIADQAILEECAVKIQDTLSDTELFSFFDEEIENNNLIMELISKIISYTMY